MKLCFIIRRTVFILHIFLWFFFEITKILSFSGYLLGFYILFQKSGIYQGQNRIYILKNKEELFSYSFESGG